MKNKKYSLGFWSAILSAIFSILWFITFSMKDSIYAIPNWQNLQAYADSFSMLRFLYIYPSLLLPISYLIIMAVLHLLVADDKKMWTLVALVIGIVYATMASINYNIQAVAVRLSLTAGETRGIEMFIPDNPNSIFNALANSYVYLAISMFFTGFIFSRDNNLGKWLRFLLFAQIITAMGQIAYSMFGLNENIFIATSMVWVIGAPAAFILLAIWFKKKAKNNSKVKSAKNPSELNVPLIIL